MDREHTTRSLMRLAQGETSAAEQLMPLVYDELRALAGSYMRGERAGHTLQATALVNEAYIRLLDIARVDWQSKNHFFAMAARQMRRVLVDHANARNAQKRGGGVRPLELEEDSVVSTDDPLALIALDRALDSLADVNPRHARVAELRLFAGMTMDEIAHVVGVTDRTVKSDWRFARVWLMQQLGVQHDDGPPV